MIHVICFFAGFSQPGVLIEKHGDNWLVEFATVTTEVNSNACSIQDSHK